MATLAGRNQGATAKPIAQGQIRPARQHKLQNGCTAQGASQQPWRILVDCLRIDAGATLQEQTRRFGLPRSNGKQQGRLAVAISCIDQCPAVERRSDRHGVAARSSLMQTLGKTGCAITVCANRIDRRTITNFIGSLLREIIASRPNVHNARNITNASTNP